MGGVIQFPRAGTRRGEAERHESRDDAPRVTRSAPQLSVIETVTSRDDDGDGGGSAA
jgi:hypothetical protein